MSEPQPNKIPSIWQIVDTYGIRVLQNNGAKPTRLLVSMSLAKKLAAELARDCYDMTNGVIPRVRLGICTDFIGMGTRIVRDDEIPYGEFDIDYVPCEHRPYEKKSRQESDFFRGFRNTNSFTRSWNCFVFADWYGFFDAMRSNAYASGGFSDDNKTFSYNSHRP